MRADPNVVSLMGALAAGILLGPSGNQIVTDGNLSDFFAQVQQWYGSPPTTVTPYLTTGNGSEQAAVPPASDYDLNESQPTHYEGFDVYVWYANQFGAAHPENPGYVNVTQPNLAQFLQGSAGGGATMTGPVGYGSQQFIPLGQPLPYTVQFGNPSTASASPGQIQIVTQLDPNLLAQSFRLGDLQIGDLQVYIPNTVGSFQGDFDFTNSKGFILRVSAGIDVNSDTVTWLIQAIDPNTGEVIQDPSKGLLAPGQTGFVTYTVQPQDGLATGTIDLGHGRACCSTRRRRRTATPSSTPWTAWPPRPP